MEIESITATVSISAFTALISSILTSVLTVRYARKNLKTTKYIETIITERIKWIDSVRNDFSLLITSILINKNNIEKYHAIHIESVQSNGSNNTIEKECFDDNERLETYNRNRLISETETAQKQCLSPTEIVIKANQLKLKLSSKKFSTINKILDQIINEYSVISLTKAQSNIDIQKLSLLSQELLSSEWNDVIDKTENA